MSTSLTDRCAPVAMGVGCWKSIPPSERMTGCGSPILSEHGQGDHLAQQIDAFVLGFQERGDGPVAFADLSQQVLRLEFAQVQFAEQVE